MSKVLFFTDLHYGKSIKARYESDVTIWGSEWGHHTVNRLVKIAKEERGSTLISGGDEATRFSGDDNQPNVMSKQSKKNARKASQLLTNRGVSIARAIGNHDHHEQAEELFFNPLSHIFEQSALPDTQIVVMQPDINTHNGLAEFSYTPESVIPVLEQTTAPNLILVSHFPFNKSAERKTYKYSNQTKPIEDHLHARLGDQSLNSVMTLHGHSHRFVMNQRSERFLSLTMPSIVQNDIDRTDMPCGLFMSAEIGHNSGLLTPRFHQMAIGKLDHNQPLYRDVDIDYMRRYERNTSAPRVARG